MRISILLPYKENFTINKSGAVSLFIKDLIKNTKHKDSTFIFGNTDQKKFLDKRYINLEIKKKIFRSKSSIYIDKFLSYETKNNSDIIEIHNRPSYVKNLKQAHIVEE